MDYTCSADSKITAYLLRSLFMVSQRDKIRFQIMETQPNSISQFKVCNPSESFPSSTISDINWPILTKATFLTGVKMLIRTVTIKSYSN